MLALSHLTAGALAGLVTPGPASRTMVALASHVLLDSVGHDDATLGLVGQGALALAGLGVLTWAWGPRSPVVAGALTAALPDAEIVARRVTSGSRPFVFPSHWHTRRRPGSHPWRLPGPDLPVLVEVAVCTAAIAAVCRLGRRRG